MNTALVLIDIQNDYFPHGRMPLEKSTEACVKAQEVLQAFRQHRLPIIHMQHISTRPDAVHFLPCTKGVDFHPQVQPLKNEIVIKKHYPNSFKDTNLLAQIQKQKINQLVVVGMMTHLCVDATVRAAYDFGLSCIVLHDATATRNLEFNNMILPAQNVHHAFLAALHRNYATVTTTREFLQKMGNKESAATV